MRTLEVIAGLEILIIVVNLTSAEFVRMCYFPNWAATRSNIAKYEVSNIDPHLCTHLLYAFGKIKTDSRELVASDPRIEEGGEGTFKKFTDLKIQNSNLKVLLSIGGQNEPSSSFISISDSDDSASSFASHAGIFLRERHFDGLDVDWEYPDAANKANFVRLMKELRADFDSGEPHLLLTFAAPAGQWNIDPGYDVPQINNYVHYALLMTYDYTSAGATIAAFNSPLFSRSDPKFNPTLSTNWTVHYWNQLGLAWEKIVVGVTGVGRWLVLRNAAEYLPGAATTGAARTGPLYYLWGGLTYPEICDVLKKPTSVRRLDELQWNPYVVEGDNWIGYEDQDSLRRKLTWMKELNVAGIFFWSLDQDDFTGTKCNQGRYPLLSFIKDPTIQPVPIWTPTGKTMRTTTRTTARITTITTAAMNTTTATTTTTEKPGPNEHEPVNPVMSEEKAIPSVIMCYFASWSRYRINEAKFQIKDVNPELCSHIIYAFAKLDEETKEMVSQEKSLEEGKNGLFQQFNALKTRYPTLKTLISIGVDRANSKVFKAITKDDDAMKDFAMSALKFLRDHGFNGLDIAWTPALKGRNRFLKLIQIINKTFDLQGGQPPVMLTLGVPATLWDIISGYDVSEIHKHVDYVILKTFEYSNRFSKRAYFNSPLFSKNDWRFLPTMSINWTVNFWKSLGMPYSKMLVGFSGEGRRFVLRDKLLYEPGSEVTGEVRFGKYYNLPGGLTYPEACEFFGNSSTRKYYDDVQKGTYMVNGDEWICIDDDVSILAKVKWIQSTGLAGGAFWTLDYDDFTGKFCGSGKFPVLTNINKLRMQASSYHAISYVSRNHIFVLLIVLTNFLLAW